MSVEIESPRIEALKKEVEKLVGKINGHDKLAKLTALIETECKEHVSITTLQRLWGYSTRRADKISERILDIVSRFVGADSWDDFCTKQSANRESVLFAGKDIINCDSLKIGCRIKLGWLPDRICEVEYLGDYRFVAIKTENSTIRPGDTFRCLQIQKGMELHMDNFTRCDEPENGSARYIVGRTNGLSIVECMIDAQSGEI